jgi:hypothetical protein
LNGGKIIINKQKRMRRINLFEKNNEGRIITYKEEIKELDELKRIIIYKLNLSPKSIEGLKLKTEKGIEVKNINDIFHDDNIYLENGEISEKNIEIKITLKELAKSKILSEKIYKIDKFISFEEIIAKDYNLELYNIIRDGKNIEKHTKIIQDSTIFIILKTFNLNFLTPSNRKISENFSITSTLNDIKNKINLELNCNNISDINIYYNNSLLNNLDFCLNGFNFIEDENFIIKINISFIYFFKRFYFKH